MDKFLFALLFALSVFAVSAWAQDCETTSGQTLYCKWNAGEPNQVCAKLSVEGTNMCSSRAADCGQANLYTNSGCTTAATGITCVWPSCTGVQESAAPLAKYCNYGYCIAVADEYSCATGSGCWEAELDASGEVIKCTSIVENQNACPACSLAPGTRAALGKECTEDPPVPSTRGDCKNASGQVLFCGYGASQCFKLQDKYPDDEADGTCDSNPDAAGCAPCQEQISHCTGTTGTLYTDVNPDALNAGNGFGKNDVDCAANGGQTTTAPSSSSSSGGGDPGSSSSSGGGPNPNPSSSSNGGQAPILLSHKVGSNMLVAMQNAINLQSAGNAVIQIYDLKGNAVRALRYSQGSYVVPLSGLPRGLYIVKASSGSWKKTVKVTVK